MAICDINVDIMLSCWTYIFHFLRNVIFLLQLELWAKRNTGCLHQNTPSIMIVILRARRHLICKSVYYVAAFLLLVSIGERSSSLWTKFVLPTVMYTFRHSPVHTHMQNETAILRTIASLHEENHLVTMPYITAAPTTTFYGIFPI